MSSLGWRPSQPLVRGNDWSSLQPPALGEWTPTLSVSVVVPTYDAPDTLQHVLASLAAQTYPAHLFEVVVVDDGSDPALELPEVRPEHTRLVRVSDGWGCANATDVGVAASDGQVLQWLDDDMLVFAEHLEAHLRWHHLVDYAVVLGTKRFVDPDPGLTPAEVRDRVADGSIARLHDWETAEPHGWVEGLWSRTDDLRTAGPRAWRTLAGATVSLSRSLYVASGGMDRSLRLGEDIEIGHRLGEAGGVLVPDHEARSWHLGPSHVMQQRELVNRYNDAALANLVPGLRPKRNRHGRRYEVPYLEVVLPADGPAERVIRCVDAVLDSDEEDLEVVLVGAWSRLHERRVRPLADPLLDLRMVHRTYRGDQRVRLVEELPPGRCRANFRMSWTGTDLVPTRPALGVLLADLERTHHGATHLLAADGTEVARIERTAAVSRAGLVGAAAPDEVDSAVAELFGTRSVAAADAGFVPWDERAIERGASGVRPPQDPDKSWQRARRALLQAEEGTPDGKSEAGPPDAGTPEGGKSEGDSPSWWRRLKS